MTTTETPAAPPTPAFLQGAPKRMLIGGQWVEATDGRTLPTINPADGSVLTEFAAGTAADIDRAVAAARAAFEGPWSGWKPFDRQRVLIRLAELVERHYDELSLLDTLDMGIPWSRWRVSRRAVAQLHWYSAQAVTLHGETIPNSAQGNFLSWTLREPVGVVGAITPWNGPISAASGRSAPCWPPGAPSCSSRPRNRPCPPSASANCAWKPAFREGVVNIVTGTGEAAGAALAAHPDVDKVAFTGSFETGQHIVRASAGT